MNPYKILHLYSNHKWTGPADHALNLAAWLKNRADVEAFFACGRRPGVENRLYQKAGARNLAVIDGLTLNKHLSWKLLPDVVALKKTIARARINLIHCHQDNDALIAALAGCGNRMLRTCYDGEPAALNIRQKFFYRRAAKIMTASHRLQAYLEAIFPDRDIQQVNIPVDCDRFRPLAKDARLLAEFGLRPDTPVGGIVARVQKHRNFELLLDAIEQVVKVLPDFRFLIVGRGTHIDTVAREPVRRRGLDRQVIFTGYRREDYRDVLNLLDYKIFLVPGSDGSCRAVREAMACAKPVVASRRGILPELIQDGQTGMLIEENPADLARAIMTMIRDTDFRQRCSRAARQYAETVLSPERYIKEVMTCYAAIIESAQNGSSNRL